MMARARTRVIYLETKNCPKTEDNLTYLETEEVPQPVQVEGDEQRAHGEVGDGQSKHEQLGGIVPLPSLTPEEDGDDHGVAGNPHHHDHQQQKHVQPHPREVLLGHEHVNHDAVCVVGSARVGRHYNTSRSLTYAIAFVGFVQRQVAPEHVPAVTSLRRRGRGRGWKIQNPT